MIDHVPERVAYEIYRRDLEGLLNTYLELTDGYIHERDTNGIIKANQVFGHRFEEELLQPIRIARNQLFTYNDPMLIPVVSTALQAEIHVMIILDYPLSLITSSLNRYKFWLMDLLSENIIHSIPTKIKKYREQYSLLVKSLAVIPNNYKCNLALESEPITSGIKQNFDYIRTIKSNSFELVQKIILDEDQLTAVQPLIQSGILGEDDLPKGIVIQNNQDMLVELKYNTYSSSLRSSSPGIIAEDRQSFNDAMRLPSCSDKDTGWQLKYISELSKDFEKNGFSLLTLGCLKAAALESLKAIKKFSVAIESKNNVTILKRSQVVDSSSTNHTPTEPQPPSLRLGADVDSGSTVLDLAKLPLGIEVMRIMALTIRDKFMDSKANVEFQALETHISKSITNPDIGYLLKVSIYTDEFGNINLPYGQLLYPLGIGLEPIDAFAEYLRRPQLRPAGIIPAGMNNNTFFIWVTKSGDILQARTIAPTFRDLFTGESVKEASRRDVLTQWRQQLPLDPYESISRAKYWADIEVARSKFIHDEESRKQINSLSSEMRSLEVELNNLYKEYQRTVFEIARHQKLSNALNTVSTLSSIIRSAIELKNLFCSTDNSIIRGSSIPAPDDISASIEMTQDLISTTGAHKLESRRVLRMEFQKMQDMEAILESLYRQSGVPLPEKLPFIAPDLM